MTPRTVLNGQPLGPFLIAGGAALLVLWLPLPFASVTPFGILLFRLSAATLLLAAVLVPHSWRANPTTLPAAALVLVAVLGLFQAHMGGPGILRQPSQDRAAGPAFAPAETTLLRTWTPTSVSPRASREAALNWGAAAALLALGGWLGRARAHRRLVGGALLAGAVFQLLYGIPRWRAGAAEIWGTAVPAGTRLRGTFVNPNHLACFLGLMVPLLFAWGWWAVHRARREELWERKVLWAAPPMLLWVVLVVAVAFTGSRGGLAAAVAAMAAQAVLLATRRNRSRLAPLAALVPAVALGAVAIVGLEQGLGRWLATSPHELAWNTRTEVFAATVELWRAAPVFGTGLGTFRDAFPLVEPSFSGIAFTHAHNDHLELLATTGLVGAGLVSLGLIALALRLLRVFRGGNRREDRAAALGALGVLIAAATHGLVEFGLSIPAMSGSAALILGLAAGAPLQPAVPPGDGDLASPASGTATTHRRPRQ